MQASDTAVTIAVVGILGTTVGALIWIIKYLFNKIVPLMENANTNIQTNNRLTKSLERTTKRADEYLRQRNGHDAEVAQQLILTTKQAHLEVIRAIAEIPAQIKKSADTTAQALHDAPIQNVEKQTVQTQVIKEKK